MKPQLISKRELAVCKVLSSAVRHDSSRDMTRELEGHIEQAIDRRDLHTLGVEAERLSSPGFYPFLGEADRQRLLRTAKGE